jgi:NosR/NirI family nitrous oxide reductase transcriptional regulator
MGDKMKAAKVVGLLILLFSLSYPLVGEGFVERRFKYKPADVLEANRFVRQKGYWEGYKDGKLAGYVFLSMDWTPKLVGYSSKPLETLIGMDTNGIITGVKIIAYSEPIFMIGISDEDYHKFLGQYTGRNIKDTLTVGREVTMDAISGATVTAVVQTATILGSARGVADATGMEKIAKRQARRIGKKYSALTWDELLRSGALENITAKNSELGLKGEDIYISLYFGVLTPPSIGRNILGEKPYNEIMKGLKPGDSAIFIAAQLGSFKGTGFAYGGIFSTFELEQGGKKIFFTGEDYENTPDINAKGAPPIREGGVFFIKEKDFDQAAPFKINLILPYYVGGKKTYKTFSAEYNIPEQFLEK